MKIKFSKRIKLKKRQLITLFALFFAAIVFGFTFERNRAQTSDCLNREALFRETCDILDRLKYYLQEPEEQNNNLFSHIDLTEDEKLVFNLKLAKNFPDGSLASENNLRRGEVLFFLRKLIDHIITRLKCKQLLINGPVYYEDIPQGHWLEESVQILEGIGALNELRGLRLYPDKKMKISELKMISCGITSYFSSNLLMIYRENDLIRLVLKGATKNLELKDSRFSFDGNTWYQTPENGVIPVSSTGKDELCLSFDHNLFLPTGSIAIGLKNIIFVKLNRDFVKMANNGFEKISNGETVCESKNIRYIQDRIRQLKKQYTIERKTDKALNKIPEFSEKIYSARGIQKDFSDSMEALKKKKECSDQQHIEIEHQKDKSYLLSGMVIDGINGTKIRNAMVLIDGKSIKTEKDGTFEFRTVKDKIIEITVYCEGYFVFRMKHRAGFKKGPLKLRLRPELATFYGKVTSSVSKKPLSNAILKIGDKTTRTDEFGRFSLKGLQTGYNQISCYCDNYLEAHEILVVEKSQSQPFVIELTPFNEW